MTSTSLLTPAQEHSRPQLSRAEMDLIFYGLLALTEQHMHLFRECEALREKLTALFNVGALPAK